MHYEERRGREGEGVVVPARLVRGGARVEGREGCGGGGWRWKIKVNESLSLSLSEIKIVFSKH